jgi:hypothetical protein
MLYPPAELVAIDRVRARDAGVSVLFDVLLESAEPFLPLVGLGVPCPAGQFLESALAIGFKDAFTVVCALHDDPLTELVAIDRVRVRDSGMSLLFDVVLESAEPRFPLVGVGVPCPPWQVLESALTVGVKGAFGVEGALPVDP